jgi:hypothetical protein
MCTVTFIPDGKTYYITSNRDESPGRNAKGLFSFHPPGRLTSHYPLDEESGGSWIALADSGRSACLLNGAFEAFIPAPPYRKSRGQVVIDAVTENILEAFLEDYALEGIAPFTLLLFENEILREIIWDGERKQLRLMDSGKPHIWSSVTLYPPHVREWRKSIFEKWINSSPEFSRESIIGFHQQANGDGENDFIMDRNNIVKTLSITSIVVKPHVSSIAHLGLDKDIREEIMVKHGE